MIKVTVVEETHEVSLEIDGKDVVIDEIDYIPTGYCGEEDFSENNT